MKLLLSLLTHIFKPFAMPMVVADVANLTDLDPDRVIDRLSELPGVSNAGYNTGSPLVKVPFHPDVISAEQIVQVLVDFGCEVRSWSVED